MTNRSHFKSGVSRDQTSLLPPRLDDYVGPDHPVRAIDAYVEALDLAKLGFRLRGSFGGRGQPAYDPKDLSKLYLYGYTNRIRSSRNLEREAGRNLELIWLLRNVTPGYRTIANFRKENGTAFKALCRDFTLLADELKLLGREFVAIDGAFFDGSASKGSITTRKKLAERVAAIDKDIEAYQSALEANDREEDMHPPAGDGGQGDGEDIGQKVAALMEKREGMQARLKRLDANGETQLSQTDPDARLLSKNGQVVAGYNVQIAVDDKHGLIVAHEAVNDGNDTGQLYQVAAAAKEELRVETLTVVADGGYHNAEALKDCEDNAITAYVPLRTRPTAKQGRLTQDEFIYDVDLNVYRCPAGALLHPSKKPKIQDGRVEFRYASRKADCDACPLRSRCLSEKGQVRELLRWEHEKVLERHRERMKTAEAAVRMRRRSALAEHPFGTLKCRAGYRHFLVREFYKVRGELSLMVLCYNFTRVLSIVGVDRFMAHLAERAGLSTFLRLLDALAAAIYGAIAFLMLLWGQIGAEAAKNRRSPSFAA